LSASGPEKAEAARQLARNALSVLESGIRNRHPQYDDRSVHLAIMRRILGNTLYRRVFPDAPRVEL
jgi:hypothetical protein